MVTGAVLLGNERTAREFQKSERYVIVIIYVIYYLNTYILLF